MSEYSIYSIQNRETATVHGRSKIGFDVYRDLPDGVQRVGGGWYAIRGRPERGVSDHELIQHYLSKQR
jgi:hypothetical protein